MDNENKIFDEEGAESAEPSVVVTKSKKSFLKPLIISASILLALAIVGVAAYAVLAQFLLFPNFATALGNTLESKLDIGTEFDVGKLIDACHHKRHVGHAGSSHHGSCSADRRRQDHS